MPDSVIPTGTGARARHTHPRCMRMHERIPLSPHRAGAAEGSRSRRARRALGGSRIEDGELVCAYSLCRRVPNSQHMGVCAWAGGVGGPRRTAGECVSGAHHMREHFTLREAVVDALAHAC
eukprot:3593051-Prymnesium_polylepis.2